MNTRIPQISALALALSALTLAPACKKDKDSTPPDDVASNDGGAGEGGEADTGEEALPALPPQDPDPAELVQFYEDLLKGKYEELATNAQQLREPMTGDTQVRAAALLASLEALARIESIPEDGQELAEQAVASGDRLADPEVQQLAHIAHAAYLIGIHDPAGAQAELEGVVGNEGAYGMFGRLVLAEAHLNQAFGTGDKDMQVVAPEKLEDAKAQYQTVVDNGDSDLLKAHAHEGLAAVADYLGNKDEACTHAQEADTLYAAGGAADGIREVPSLLAKKARCKDFKKAE